MVSDFKMTSLFPELARQPHIDPIPRRQRLSVQFFIRNTDPNHTSARSRMRLTLRHLAILAILSSPFQMLTLDEMHQIIWPVVSKDARETLKDSMRLVVWRWDEFEKIGDNIHGVWWRWNSDRQRQVLRLNYQGAVMDKILLDTEHAYSIVVENQMIKEITKTD